MPDSMTAAVSAPRGPESGAGGGLRLYYQQIAATFTNELGATQNAQGIQSTLSCTSEDGETWAVDPNFIVDVPLLAMAPGNGHTGYFLPWELDGKIGAYSLWGSGDYPGQVLHRCLGELNDWTTDQRLLGYHVHYCDMGDAVERYVVWHEAFPVRTRHGLFLVGNVSNFVSGGAAANAMIALWPLAEDLRTVLGPAVEIWRPTLPWGTVLRSVTPYVEDGVLHIVYVCGDTEASLNVGVLRHAG